MKTKPTLVIGPKEYGHTNDPCEWCSGLHGGIWCPIVKKQRERLYNCIVIPAEVSQGRWVDAVVAADSFDEATWEMVGLEVFFRGEDGNPLEVMYNSELFEEIEYNAAEVLATEVVDDEKDNKL